MWLAVTWAVLVSASSVGCCVLMLFGWWVALPWSCCVVSCCCAVPFVVVLLPCRTGEGVWLCGLAALLLVAALWVVV